MRKLAYLLILATLLFPPPVRSADRGIVINAVGDIMMAASASPVLKKMGYDYPFARTVSELKNGDLTVGNLETPVAGYGREYVAKKYRFLAEPRCAPALKRAGFDLVTLANNHIMDFGPDALETTRMVLSRSGIATVGAGSTLAAARKAEIIEAKGKKVAFLSYSFTMPAEFFATTERPGTAPGYYAFFLEDITAARKKADYVLVSFHWGREASSIPAPYQVDAAHRAVDAGADVVIGHHPHVLQGVELYKKGVVFYSLGNFVFGSYSGTADRSAIARITLDKGVKKVEMIPLNVLNREVLFQPRLLRGKEGGEVASLLAAISERWGTTVMESGGRYFVGRQQTTALAGR